MIRGLTVPHQRLGVIPPDASAGIIHIAKAVICFGIALLRGFLVPLACLIEIPGDAITVQESVSECRLCLRITTLSGPPKARQIIRSAIGTGSALYGCHVTFLRNNNHIPLSGRSLFRNRPGLFCVPRLFSIRIITVRAARIEAVILRLIH